MLIKNFKNLSKSDIKIAGGKGASLGEMTHLRLAGFGGQAKAKISVPPGFVVLAAAFDKFLAETDLIQEVEAALDKINYHDVNSVDNASRAIRGLIQAASFPDDLKKPVIDEFSRLKTKFVAVRSSATAEDSSAASWAGELESYLNVEKGHLFDSIKKCWASLFTPRAIVYRQEKGLRKTKVSVAVVIQRMVAAEVAGVSFTVHPVTKDKSQMIHEAVWGLGEALVSGQITPDSYVVNKKSLEIVDGNVNTQFKKIVRNEKGGDAWKPVPKSAQRKAKLTEKQIKELTKICLKIEQHYKFPCDVEWAIEKNKIYIVQARPITTLD